MKALFFILSLLLASTQYDALAQRKFVLGKVLDNKTQKGLTGLSVSNQQTKQTTRTNDQGVFFLWASAGDSLIMTSLEYGRMGMIWDGQNREPVMSAKKQAIALQEVTITSKRSEKIDKEIEAFLAEPKASKNMTGEEIFAMVSSPVSLLYEMFSKEGKSRRRLAVTIQKDRKTDYANMRFNPQLVARMTNLKGQEIDKFMTFCSFSEDFILQASDYELALETFKCLRVYQQQKNGGRS